MGFSKEEAEEMYSTIASPTMGVVGATALAEIAGRIAGKGSIVGKTYSGAKDLFSGKDTDADKQTVNSTNESDKTKTNGEKSDKTKHNYSFD